MYVYHSYAMTFGRCGSHGSRVAVPQGLSLCDSYERCFWVYACVHVCVPCYNEHNLEKVQPTGPLNFKSTRAVRHTASVAATAANLAYTPIVGSDSYYCVTGEIGVKS